jgi:hypothetical protein
MLIALEKNVGQMSNQRSVKLFGKGVRRREARRERRKREKVGGEGTGENLNASPSPTSTKSQELPKHKLVQIRNVLIC